MSNVSVVVFVLVYFALPAVALGFLLSRAVFKPRRFHCYDCRGLFPHQVLSIEVVRLDADNDEIEYAPVCMACLDARKARVRALWNGGRHA